MSTATQRPQPSTGKKHSRGENDTTTSFAEERAAALAQKRAHEEKVRGLVSVLSVNEQKHVFGVSHRAYTTLTAVTGRLNGHQALAPPRFMTPYETAIVCCMDDVEELDADKAKHQSDTTKLVKELHNAFMDESQAMKARLAAEESSASKIAQKTAKNVFRRWNGVGNTAKQQVRVAFDVMKMRSAKGKQDEMLRDTEELTRKLISSVIRESAARKKEDGEVEVNDDKKAEEEEGASMEERQRQLEQDIFAGGDSGPAFEGRLSLLNTLNGERPLRDYQRSALRWMINLYNHNLNGILADEMGLGKTVQTIALLAYFAEYKKDWGPHVVVVPTTVVLNWEMEFRRWLPGFKCISYIGSAKERKQLRQGWTKEGAFNVVITSYGVICRDRSVFRRRPWGFLILDEAHTIKNWASQKWQTLFDFQAEYRLLLTGTPLQNSVMELWSLFHFLLPSVSAFESNDQFREWFSDPMNEMVVGSTSINEDLIKRMHALFRPFLLRRLKKDVETQLPGKTERVILCRLSKRQASMYLGYLAMSRASGALMRGGYSGAMGLLLNLRKVCDHPELLAERPTVSPFITEGGGYSCEVRMYMPRLALLQHNDDDRRYFSKSLKHQPTRQAKKDWAPCDRQLLRFVCDCSVSSFNQLFAEHQGNAAFNLSQLDELMFSADSNLHDYFSLLRMDELMEKCSEDHEAQAGNEPFSATATSTQYARMRAFFDNAPLFFNNSGTSNTAGAGKKPSTSALWKDLASVYEQEAQRQHNQRRQKLQQHQVLLRLRLWAAIQLFVPIQFVRQEVYPHLKSQVLAREEYQHLVPTLKDRLKAMQPIAHKFCLYVPSARAKIGPSLAVNLPVAHFKPFRRPIREDLLNLLGISRPKKEARGLATSTFTAKHFASEMWGLHNRRCFNFPEKALVQHDAGKLQVLAPLLKQLISEGHRALIFTQFTVMLGVLEKFLALLGLKYLRLDGTTKPEVRQQLVERFNCDPTIGVMILSTRSGGIGINLTGADTVVFYDSDWNPSMDLQAQDRVHRIGQTRPVTIYRLVCEGTCEERILQKARERKKLNNVVIRGGAFNKGVTGIMEVVESKEDGGSKGDQGAENGGDRSSGVKDGQEAPNAKSRTDAAVNDFLFSSGADNIRDYFHDFDEDYEPQQQQGEQGGGNDDANQAMGEVEDEEDIAARKAVEAEMGKQQEEDHLLSGDLDPRKQQLRGEEEDRDDDDDDLEAAGDKADDMEHRAIRKKKMEIGNRACETSLERYMLGTYAKLHKNSLKRAYDHLVDEFDVLEKKPSFETCMS